MPQSFKERIEAAEMRSQVYGLLSALYLELPNLKLLQNVFEADFEQGLSSAASKVEAWEMKEGLKLIENFIAVFKGRPREEVLKLVSIDRTRLFRGVSPQYGPPPPYESVYMDGGTLWGKSTIEVSKIYSSIGVKLPEVWTEPPDYIGIELDFMQLICQGERDAWQANNIDNAVKYLEAGRDFLRDHLARWIPNFCEKMYERANLDFYKGLAKLTQSFVEYDNHLADRQVSEAKKLTAKH